MKIVNVNNIHESFSSGVGKYIRSRLFLSMWSDLSAGKIITLLGKYQESSLGYKLSWRVKNDLFAFHKSLDKKKN